MRSPGDGFQLREALKREVAAAIAALETDPMHPKAVHKCRISIKRARALARIGAVAAPGLAGVFQSVARQAKASLAGAREPAALSEAARAIAARQPKQRATALTRIADALDAENASGAGDDIERAKASLRDLAALAQVWPETSRRQIHKGAERVARRARTAAKRGRKARNPERRHAWRKREKERFYALSILAKDWPHKRRRRASERLGDLLGRERDALLLAERIGADPALSGDAKTAKRALRALLKQASRLGARADELGARVHAGGA